MLHKFFEDGDWFAAKTYGYGAGLPIAWQGWVLVAAYVGLMAGLGLLLDDPDIVDYALWGIGVALSTAVFLLIAKKRTRGGWRWRSGEDDGRSRTRRKP